MAFRLLLSLIAAYAACALVPNPMRSFSPTRGTVVTSSSRYDHWVANVDAFEKSRVDPWVYVDESPGRGLGVFARRPIPAATTITEWVGCLALTPETVCDELELQQEYYGPMWRSYSQRYEIGLSGSRVVRAAGTSLGGSIAREESVIEECDASDASFESCVTRAGEGEFILLGKVPEQGATPHEGVAQLINDHTALRAPLVSPMRSTATAKSAAFSGDGAIKPADVDGFLIFESEVVPVDADLAALENVVDQYIANIASMNNVALVQAKLDYADMSAPRVFAVATRPIPAGQELFYTYGVEWWLAQLRRAALAQLVTCQPSPPRAATLASLIRAVEHVSAERVSAQAKAIARAGSMPSRYVLPLEPLAPLDQLLSGNANSNWQKALLHEELASATECPVEALYAQAHKHSHSRPSSASPPTAQPATPTR